MRILIVSQYYLPEPAKISVDLAAELTDLGHQVKVLTGYPNYPKGKIYPGYKQQWRFKESLEGIEICRVPLFLDHSQNAIKRILNYVSFSLSSSTARKYAQGADVIYVYATQMTAAFGPWLWRLTGGRPYVLHVQDLWPDSIVGSSLSGSSRNGKLITFLLQPWMSAVYRRASAVIGIAPTMVASLVSRGIDPERAEMVYNWADSPTEYQEPSLSSSSVAAQTRIVYAGNVGDMQGLNTACLNPC